MKSTNYENVFIQVAEDCKAKQGEAPPQKKQGKTVANLEYEMISANPYKYTSDDVKFQVHAQRKNISKSEQKNEREVYFSKGQPCFRASPLTKTYGWGVHNDEQGRMAIYGVETQDYQKFLSDKTLEKVKAMRSKRA